MELDLSDQLTWDRITVKQECLSFGSRLAQERKARELSQEELAKILFDTFAVRISDLELNDIEHDRLDVRGVPKLFSSLQSFLQIDPEEAECLAANIQASARRTASEEVQISEAVMAFRRSPYVR